MLIKLTGVTFLDNKNNVVYSNSNYELEGSRQRKMGTDNSSL